MAKIKLPKLTLPVIRKVVIFAVTAAIIFSSGYYLGLRNFQVSSVNNYPKVTISRDLPTNRQTLDFSLFWKVWDTVDSMYFDKTKIIPSKLVYGAIQGMVAAIGDPYTAYFPPDQNKIVNQDLNGGLEGVGIQIGFKGTQLAVIAPLPGTPAEKAGIKAGDFIVGIKDDVKKIDTGTGGMALEQAVEYIRGPEGSKVTLIIARDVSTKPLTIDLIRAKINVPSVVLTWEGSPSTGSGSIAHIKLLKFAQDTDGEWDGVVNQINNKCRVQSPECKIVLDLRNNPGGYLQGAVDIASDFLPQNTTVVIEENGKDQKRENKTSRNPRLADYPSVVLINGGSASASEILAGALRDQKSVKLIGEKSFGKGTIQEPDDLPDGSGLHITIAKWLTPNGTWVHGNGLDPDVKVIPGDNDKTDIQLDKAIELL